MTVQTRATLKGYFDTGDTITASAMVDVIDSFAHLLDTTAQTFNSEISTPNLVAANVSAGTVTITGKITASAATLTGRIRHGVSAAASAADSRGDFVVAQESTVAGAATAQVANLPSTSNIVRLFAKVLVGGSVGAGGLNIVAGTPDARDFFGKFSVSATGLHEIATVSARRLTGVSGAVQFVASGASANTNIIGGVAYYQRA